MSSTTHSREGRFAWKWAVPLLLVWTLLAGRSYFSLGADPWLLSLFHLSFLAMLALALPKPRVDAYSFLALFLFLGFWAKFVAHQWFDYPFVEPTGAFDGSADQWNTALAASTAAALGIALTRVLQLCSRRWRRLHDTVERSPPEWYLRSPSPLWIWAGVAAVIFYALNFHYAFYVTGVETRLVLPLKLNVAVNWLAYCGVGLLVMLMADWEFRRRPDRLWPLVIALCAFGLVMSVSLASRASSLFLFSALAMACLAHRRIPLARFFRNGGWKWPAIMAATLAVSLVLVSAVRLSLYEVAEPMVAAAPPEMPVATEAMHMAPAAMLRQVMLLSVDRWVGLEAMLALAASDAQGPELLAAGLREDPAAGVNALFQRIAHSTYVEQPGFTYLTLPGFPAILFYGGSLLLVTLGMAAATALITLLDGIALRLTGSRLLVAWLGLLLANTLCQMSFPYLSLVFVINTLLAMLGYWMFTHLLPLAQPGRAHHP